MPVSNLLRRILKLKRDENGSYIIEFAVLSLPMMTLLMGGMEIGYQAYAKANIEGALREVSRLAATGSMTTEELDAVLHSNIRLYKGATVEIERKSYSSFGAVGQPEPLVSDVEPIGGTPSVGDCFTDVNDNGVWDADRGSSGVGGSEDILYYGVQVEYPMIFKLTSTVLNNGQPNIKMNANAVIKNEPFSNVAKPVPEKICICTADKTWEDGTCKSV